MERVIASLFVLTLLAYCGLASTALAANMTMQNTENGRPSNWLEGIAGGAPVPLTAGAGDSANAVALSTAGERQICE